MRIVIGCGREIVKLIKIWTNGCFDILHRGHIELFKYAKSLGNELIVGVDSDRKVARDKGHNRPINNLEDRMEMLRAIRYIDSIVYFDSIDELVVGEKYAKEVRFFNRIGEYSTTKIANDTKIIFTV
jgi:cytidyltransferase-like protein